jgi:hypothetical protein
MIGGFTFQQASIYHITHSGRHSSELLTVVDLCIQSVFVRSRSQRIYDIYTQNAPVPDASTVPVQGSLKTPYKCCPNYSDTPPADPMPSCSIRTVRGFPDDHSSNPSVPSSLINSKRTWVFFLISCHRSTIFLSKIKASAVWIQMFDKCCRSGIRIRRCSRERGLIGGPAARLL